MTKEEFLLSSSQKFSEKSEDIEDILTFLRQEGCSKSQSIIILKKIKNIDLDKAKELVHFSKTWQDMCQMDEDFHQHLHEVFSKK